MKPAHRLLLTALLVAAASASGACGSEKNAPDESRGGQTSSAGAESANGGAVDTVELVFGASACRACQAEACDTPETACSSEPSCAAVLDCLDACPATRQGGIDPGCDAACQPLVRSEFSHLARAVSSCRSISYGALCSCGSRPNSPELLMQACEASAETNTCYKCEAENCCESYAACEADPACDAYMECQRVCPSSGYVACEQECSREHESGYQKGLERLACLRVWCSDEDACGNEALDACRACYYAKCDDEYVECAAGVDCSRMRACMSICESGDCFESCSRGNPAGALQYELLMACTIARCASECG